MIGAYGYMYPRGTGSTTLHTEFKTRFSPPEEVVLVEKVTDELKKLPRVQWEGVGIPAEHGSDSVYTIAWGAKRGGAGSRSVLEGFFGQQHEPCSNGGFIK